MFAFVRDQVRTDGYAGLMRGPAGTLQSRDGSPIDKAYLLAVMLQTASVPVQLVHAPLTDAQIQQLVDAIGSSPTAQSAASPRLADALRQSGVDAAARQRAAENASRVDAMADDGIAAAQSPVDHLNKVLTVGSAALASSDAAVVASWRANLRDHWWLRVQQDGAWADWDPTLAGAQPGTHLGSAPQEEGVSEPPADQRTTLTVRLVADYAGGSTSRTVLEGSSTVDRLYALPVAVAVGDRSRGSQDLKAARSFTPSLTFGDAETAGDAFELDPEGGLRVAALRLEIVTVTPGSAPRLTTRTFLDRRDGHGGIGASWTPERSAYAATTAFSMLAISGDLDPGFAARREADGLKALRAFVAYVSAGGYGKQSPSPAMAAAYPMESLHYFEQDAIVRRRLESRTKVRFRFDRPQIVMVRRSLTLDGNRVSGIEQFDIVDNGMSATGPDAAAIRANFTRGYIDTVIEQHLLAAQTDGGAIGLFAAAARGGVAERVSADPKYGGTAIVLAQPVEIGGRARTGWWQVERSTGNLVGRMDDGAGQGLVEYAMARANDWFTIYAMLQFYGDFFRCIAGAVEGPLAGREAGSAAAQEWFKQCAGAALCGYLEALATGEGFSRLDNDLLALIYNILDMSIPGTKDPWGPTLGAACSKAFTNPFG